VQNCRAISAALKSSSLIKKIISHGNGRLEVRSIPWPEYWKPFLSCRDESISARLLELQSSRTAYIEGRFSLDLARRYCFSCFLLLSTVIERVARGTVDRAMLSAVLAMECFTIRRAEDGAVNAVAATSNIRNPVYLLAKLKCPKAYDDPKFVPLILGRGASDSATAATHLFYYYRQFVIESHRGITLLVYPAVADEHRAKSFRCIELVTNGLVAKTDPRAARRADWIADCAVGPFFRSCCPMARVFLRLSVRSVIWL